MEPLLQQVRQLPKKFGALSTGMRLGLLGGTALFILALFGLSILKDGGVYQYVFTNLSPEDSAEAAGQLKAAGIPFRVEASGSALAVPASHVYDARLLLASVGLPKGGGVGFEVFDKGDLGVSEFTQQINLRRATEGELGRTIGRLSAVRTARVHLTFAQHGLYRDDDREASAAVVVDLRPGRTLGERELAGMRHLVASAVPGLRPAGVTIVDGQGAVLAGDDDAGAKASDEQRRIERTLERRVVELLSRAVGHDAVVAKVTADVDASQVERTADAYDPEAAAVRSERVTTEESQTGGTRNIGLAGAAANQPMGNAGAPSTAAQNGASKREDEVRNFEISKTVTRTIETAPRVRRLSVAVLVDGIDGKARGQAELDRLRELAKSAVGFDAKRGDQLEISSAPFAKSDGAEATGDMGLLAKPAVRYGAAGVAAVLLILIVLILAKRKGRAQMSKEVALIKPGVSVAEVERQLNASAVEGAVADAQAALAGAAERPALVDPNVTIRARAQRLVSQDPERAAMLIKAWIRADHEEAQEESLRAAS